MKKKLVVACASAITALALASCSSDEPRLSQLSELTQNNAQSPAADSEVEVAPPAPVETSNGADGANGPSDAVGGESGAGGAVEDSLAGVESSVVVPDVEINFLLGAENACVSALALTPAGKLTTPGFTYDDKSCRKLISSIPMPNLPKKDVDTAYLRGFQEMLSIMFRPGELCAPTGECFTKDQVLPLVP